MFFSKDFLSCLIPWFHWRCVCISADKRFSRWKNSMAGNRGNSLQHSGQHSWRYPDLLGIHCLSWLLQRKFVPKSRCVELSPGGFGWERFVLLLSFKRARRKQQILGCTSGGKHIQVGHIPSRITVSRPPRWSEFAVSSETAEEIHCNCVFPHSHLRKLFSVISQHGNQVLLVIHFASVHTGDFS